MSKKADGNEVPKDVEMGWDKKLQRFVLASELQPTTRIRHIYTRMPFTWLRDVSRLPKSALLVSHVLWYLASTQRCATVSLGNTLLREVNVNRFAKYRGLRALGDVGLVTVEKESAGMNMFVTIHHPEAGK
jgi:hypothetical protein